MPRHNTALFCEVAVPLLVQLAAVKAEKGKGLSLDWYASGCQARAIPDI